MANKPTEYQYIANEQVKKITKGKAKENKQQYWDYVFIPRKFVRREHFMGVQPHVASWN